MLTTDWLAGEWLCVRLQLLLPVYLRKDYLTLMKVVKRCVSSVIITLLSGAYAKRSILKVKGQHTLINKNINK